MEVSSLFPLEMLSTTEASTLKMSSQRFLFVSGLSYQVMLCTANT